MNLGQNITQLKTIMRKEVVRFRRIWIQALIPPIITTALYFIIFGNLIGRYIPEIKGYAYIDYIVPGLVMMAVINNAYVNVVSSFFSAKFQRNIEELLVSPTPSVMILMGFVSGGVARGLGVGVLVLFIAECFTDITVYSWFTMFFVIIMSALLFSVLGFINAVFAKKFDDISLVPTFILQPLTYLGGVFYSIHLLPDFWQTVSLFNPIFYVINAFRYSMLGVYDVQIVIALLLISIANIIALFIAWSLLHRGVGLRT